MRIIAEPGNTKDNYFKMNAGSRSSFRYAAEKSPLNAPSMSRKTTVRATSTSKLWSMFGLRLIYIYKQKKIYGPFLSLFFSTPRMEFIIQDVGTAEKSMTSPSSFFTS